MKNFIIAFIGFSFITALTLSLTSMDNPINEPAINTNMQDIDFNLQESIEAGKAIYEGKGTCVTCHQKNGAGIPPTFPPLANADYLLENKHRAIHQTMYGSDEPITVNGTTYPGGIMTTVELTDKEVRDVVNYILNSWGNDGGVVTVEDVKAQRE